MRGTPPDVLLHRSPAVIARSIDGETVIYTETGRRVFALDRVATVVWALLANPQPVSQLCAVLANTFDVDVSTIAHDLRSPLSTLIAAEIVQTDVLNGSRSR
jgi:hypothetical protein